MNEKTLGYSDRLNKYITMLNDAIKLYTTFIQYIFIIKKIIITNNNNNNSKRVIITKTKHHSF